MDEYEWVRARGEQLIREAELDRLAADGRRSAHPANRSKARPLRRRILGTARLWPRPAHGRRGLRTWSALGGSGTVR